jgi:hypothetical protein
VTWPNGVRLQFRNGVRPLSRWRSSFRRCSSPRLVRPVARQFLFCRPYPIVPTFQGLKRRRGRDLDRSSCTDLDHASVIRPTTLEQFDTDTERRERNERTGLGAKDRDPVLEQSDNFTVRKSGHSLRGRLLRQSRHRHDVAALCDDETRARGRPNFVHRDAEAARSSEARRIVGE